MLLEAETVKQPFSDIGMEIRDMYQEDHPEDHELWIELLSMAAEHSTMLYECLEWMRSVGTILVPDPRFGYRLKPIIDGGENAWKDEAQYKHEAAFLRPYQKTMINFLAKLAKKGNFEHD